MIIHPHPINSKVLYLFDSMTLMNASQQFDSLEIFLMLFFFFSILLYTRILFSFSKGNLNLIFDANYPPPSPVKMHKKIIRLFQ